MKDERTIGFIPMCESHLKTLAPMMKEAFDEDSMLQTGRKDGPTGYDNGDFLRKWGLESGADAYTIQDSGKIIGAILLFINKDTHENYLGNIFFDVSTRGKGYGQTVWNMIEGMYPDTKIWRTDTPGYSRRNHYFYVVKCGFKIVDIKNPLDPYDSSYIFEKVMNPPV